MRLSGTDMLRQALVSTHTIVLASTLLVPRWLAVRMYWVVEAGATDCRPVLFTSRPLSETTISHPTGTSTLHASVDPPPKGWMVDGSAMKDDARVLARQSSASSLTGVVASPWVVEGNEAEGCDM